MSNVKQVGKLLRKSANESAQNIRRISENFPQVERAVDSISTAQSFKKEFFTGKKPSVKISLGIEEMPQIDCVTAPVDQYIACEADCIDNGGGQWGGGGIPADGNEYPVNYAHFDANIGGFTLNPLASGGGVTIPLDGIYRFYAEVEYGSVGWGGAWISLSARHNGFPMDRAILTQTNGCGLCGVYGRLSVSATVYCKAGDYLGVWTGAIAGLFFFTPFNLCGFAHLIRSPTIIELIGQP